MYERYYRLDADPFRLAADLHFVFRHKGYRKAYASMRYALQQGDGILVITGPPGSGKTMLIESFCAELQSENIAIATLASTHLTGDDVLGMVAYEFGFDPYQKPKAVILHELKNILSQQACAVLIIDEAQNLPTVALEELRMLSNLKRGSRPLLQIFLIGQEALHKQLHAPGMEQLHQRLSATFRLRRLELQTTRDFVLHRLSSADWSGQPGLAAELFPVIHRFSQGLPRYICKFCSRLFLYGAMNERQQLSADDAVAVIAILEQEMLLPMHSEQDTAVAEPLPHLAELLQSQGRPLAQRLSLSDEETDFLANTPTLLDAPLDKVTAKPAAKSPLQSQPPRDRADFPSWYSRISENIPAVPSIRPLGYGALLAVLIFGSYKFGVTSGHSIPAVATVSPAPVKTRPAPIGFAAADLLTNAAQASPQATIVIPLKTSATFTAEPDSPLASIRPADRAITILPPRPLHIAPTSLVTRVPVLLRTEDSTTVLPTATGDPVSEPITVTPPTLEEQIAALLRLADQAFASDQLRIPESDNAWSYYQQVLALDPGNAAASEGLQQIATRYAQLARWRMSSQDYDKADVYLDRGLAVVKEHNGLLTLRQEVESLRLAEAVAAAEAEAATAAALVPAPQPEINAEPESGGFLGALKRIFGGNSEASE